MKATTLKKTYIVAIAITALANATSSMADGPFNNALGASTLNVERTDVWGLTCPGGTASVRASVTNPNGSASDEIAVQVINPNGRAASVISIENLTKPTAVLGGGPGNYLVTVHKSQTDVAVNYSISLDCWTGGAAPAPIAGNQSALIQNQ